MIISSETCICALVAQKVWVIFFRRHHLSLTRVGFKFLPTTISELSTHRNWAGPRLQPQSPAPSNGWPSSATAAGLPQIPSPPLSLELKMLWLQQQKWFSRYGMADSMEDTFYEKKNSAPWGPPYLRTSFDGALCNFWDGRINLQINIPLNVSRIKH